MNLAIKAVGLLSGGLDSTLACKIVKDQGVDVHALFLTQPWGCCDKGYAFRAAQALGIPLVVMRLDESYLETIRNPKYGYGVELNPCVDCRIHMFSTARRYMESIGARFVFTGEVLGQRPMSQVRAKMRVIERDAGLEGLLVRPLSAKHLEPTVPETEGWLDRENLLSIEGRSREIQMQLARDFGIEDYPSPAGGCLLTDPHFARRMRDVFKHGYQDFRDVVNLRFGKHFRLTPLLKAVLGRDQEENLHLKSVAGERDFIFELPDRKGPTLVLKGVVESDAQLRVAAGLVQRFSKRSLDGPVPVEYRRGRYGEPREILSESLDGSAVAAMQI